MKAQIFLGLLASGVILASAPSFAQSNRDMSNRLNRIEPSKFGDQLGWAGIATVANLPSTVIPLGVNKAGLPLAVQAIGPFLEDKTTIAFAGMTGHDIVAPPTAG